MSRLTGKPLAWIWASSRATPCPQRGLVEVVANLPKELVISRCYARIPDLIRPVQRKLGSELDDGTGVHVPSSVVPGVPLGRQCKTIIHSLLKCELSPCSVGGRDNVSRKVVTSKANASPMLPLLSEACVKVVAGIVRPLTDGEK